MESVLIAAIVFGSIVFALAMIPVTILMAIKMFRARTAGSNPGFSDNEARMIQEIYQGLSRMEQRVEALETLLLEKERKEKQ